jgi:class 3 adenylate cyclase/tetratricopeptide (TPR) repeat protein
MKYQKMLDWLKNLELETYLESFAKNGINLRALPHLTEQDLKDLGVLLGHRRILMSAIEALTIDELSQDEHQETVSQLAEPSTEHRQVTILFADLVGYTQMSAELDAEDLHIILGHFLDTVDRIILQHGGTIDKHVGDSAMAVFGAPTAHSDDPARAVRAALAIKNAMPAVSKLVDRTMGVHSGIANGLVLASGVGNDAHYTVTGDSVNLASRLTDAAGEGEILLSQGVQTATSGEFELGDKGRIELKGLSEPVHVYSVLGLLNVAAEQNERPFVGRQVELHQFTGILKACSEIKSGQVICLRGEAGIGKTRLSAKFASIAKEHGYVCHRALILDFGVAKEQSVLRTLVRSLLSISESAVEKERVQAVELACEQGLLDSGQRVFVNALLDIPQSADLRSLYDAIDSDGRELGNTLVVTTLLGRLSVRQPLLIFIEDIHWAEVSVIIFLAKLARALVDCTCLLVMTSRIEGDPLGHAWKLQTSPTSLTTLDLQPLRHVDAMALAADYFDETSRFAKQCVERADGNPLYLEQLLRSAEEVGEDQLPGSIHSIVQARLDSLQSRDKQAIQAASVLGQRFEVDDIRFMIEDTDYTVDGLIERHLIKPEGEAFLFSHALVQEAVYQSLLKSSRSALHRLAARRYEQRELELCAVHLDRADDPGAMLAYLKASVAQIAELQFESGLRMADRGIEIAHDDEIKCELLLVRAEALRNLGEIEQSISVCRKALDFAQNDGQSCHAWLSLAQGLRIADQQQDALEILDLAQTVAFSNDLKEELSRIHYMRGNLFFMTGDIEGCLDQHQKSLALADETESAESRALAMGGVGDAYYLRGHMRSARDQFQRCIEVCREHGFGQIEVSNRNMVGWSRIYLMEFPEAMVDALESVEMAQKVGHQRAEMIGVELAGFIELERGNLANARGHLEHNLELATLLNSGNFLAQSRFLLARLDEAEGNHVAAQENIKLALAKIREVGTAFTGPSVLAVCAALASDAGQRSAFLREAEKILDVGCVSHNYVYFARTAIELSLKNRDWNSVNRYVRRLEVYTQHQSLEWCDYLIARGRALAKWGSGEQSNELVQELERLVEQTKKAGLNLLLPELKEALQAG